MVDLKTLIWEIAMRDDCEREMGTRLHNTQGSNVARNDINICFHFLSHIVLIDSLFIGELYY